MKHLFFALFWAFTFSGSVAQPRFDYRQPFVCTSQLGFRVTGEKTVTLYGGEMTAKLPDEVAFFIQPIGNRAQRATPAPAAWNVPGNVFRYPIGIGEGPFVKGKEQAGSVYRGVLRKVKTRWGTLWRGDFSDFQQEGFFQIETEHGLTAPFAVEPYPYERLERSYLEYLYAQRSGTEIPGVRPVENGDDARFFSDETRYLPVAGGWNDAGDHRKWMFQTLSHLEILALLAAKGHPAFRERALADMSARLSTCSASDPCRMAADRYTSRTPIFWQGHPRARAKWNGARLPSAFFNGQWGTTQRGFACTTGSASGIPCPLVSPTTVSPKPSLWAFWATPTIRLTSKPPTRSNGARRKSGASRSSTR